MQKYLIQFLTYHPDLLKNILSLVSANMSRTIATDLVKAVYGHTLPDRAVGYRSLYEIAIGDVSGKLPVFPHKDFIREEIKAKRVTVLDVHQDLYHGLENAILVNASLAEEQASKIEEATTQAVEAFKAYSLAYGKGDHAAKIGQIVTILDNITQSNLPAIVKFKEVQRLFYVEIHHKLVAEKKEKDISKYLELVRKKQGGQSIVEYLGSKDFIKTSSTFSQAIVGLHAYLEDAASPRSGLAIDTLIKKMMENSYEVGLNALVDRLEHFSDINVDSDILKLAQAVLNALASQEVKAQHHIDIYNALRTYLSHSPEQKIALLELLRHEDYLANEVVRFILADERGKEIAAEILEVAAIEFKEQEGSNEEKLQKLGISDEVIRSAVDNEKELLEAYSLDNITRAVANFFRDKGLEFSSQIDAIISGKENALERLGAIHNLLINRNRVKLDEDSESTLKHHTYKVFGDLDDFKILERSVRVFGKDKSKIQEYFYRAFENIIISYQAHVITKIGDSDFTPTINAPVQRDRAPSTRLRFRGYSFFSSMTSFASTPMDTSSSMVETPFARDSIRSQAISTSPKSSVSSSPAHSSERSSPAGSEAGTPTAASEAGSGSPAAGNSAPPSPVAAVPEVIMVAPVGANPPPPPPMPPALGGAVTAPMGGNPPPPPPMPDASAHSLEDALKGVKLKKTEKPSEANVAPDAAEGRDALLDAIKKGTTLRPFSERLQAEAEAAAKERSEGAEKTQATEKSLFELLGPHLAKRRRGIAGDSDDKRPDNEEHEPRKPGSSK